MKYRKKPVVVEAVRWTGNNHAEMCDFIDPEHFEILARSGLIIHTLEGDLHASIGDYIIKGVEGEFYPCKPDIFFQTYEAVNEGRSVNNPKWITFSHGGRELVAISITGLMPNEIQETIKLIAYENNIESCDIVIGTR